MIWDLSWDLVSIWDLVRVTLIKKGTEYSHNCDNISNKENIFARQTVVEWKASSKISWICKMQMKTICKSWSNQLSQIIDWVDIEAFPIKPPVNNALWVKPFEKLVSIRLPLTQDKIISDKEMWMYSPLQFCFQFVLQVENSLLQQ